MALTIEASNDVASGFQPGDAISFDLDLGTLAGPDTPTYIEGTLLSYDGQFGAWKVVDWAQQRVLIVLAPWIVSVGHPSHSV